MPVSECVSRRRRMSQLVSDDEMGSDVLKLIKWASFILHGQTSKLIVTKSIIGLLDHEFIV